MDSVDPHSIHVVDAYYLLFFGRNATPRDIEKKRLLSDTELLRSIALSPEFETNVLTHVVSRTPLRHGRRLSAPDHFAAWLIGRHSFNDEDAENLADSPDWWTFFVGLCQTSVFRESIAARPDDGPRMAGRAQAVADLLRTIEALAPAKGILLFRRRWAGIAEKASDRVRVSISEGAQEALSLLFGAARSSTISEDATVRAALASQLQDSELVQALVSAKAGGSLPVSHWRAGLPTKTQREELAEIFKTISLSSASAPRSWPSLLRAALQDIELIAASLDLRSLPHLLLLSAIAHYRDPAWSAAVEPSVPARLHLVLHGAEKVAAKVDAYLVDGTSIGTFAANVEEDGTAIVELTAPLVDEWGSTDEGTKLRPQQMLRSDGTEAIAQPAAVAILIEGEPIRLIPVTIAGPLDAVLVASDISVGNVELMGRVARVSCAVTDDRPLKLMLALDDRTTSLTQLPSFSDQHEVESTVTYVGVLDFTPDAPFVRHDCGAVAEKRYAIRAESQLGPLLSGGPDRIEPAAAAIIAGAPRIAGGRICGWAFPTGNPYGSKTIRAIAVVTDAVEKPEDPVILVSAAQLPSPEPQAAYGDIAASVGFEIPLSPAILDGRPRRVSLAGNGEKGMEVFCNLDIEANAVFALEQARGCRDPKELTTFLSGLAAAGNGAALAGIYEVGGQTVSSLPDRTHFQVLCTLFAAEPGTLSNPVLASAFEALWRGTLADSKRLGEFATIIVRGALNGIGQKERSRFPTSPLAENVVDLLLLSERYGPDDPDAFGRMTSEAAEFRRFELARRIINRGLRKHPANATVKTAGARLSLAIGAVADARSQAIDALTTKRGYRDAELTLARAFASEGRALDSVAIASGGRGLNAHIERPVSPEIARLASPLDWRGYLLSSAEHNGRQVLNDALKRTDAIFTTIGQGLPLYSVFVIAPPTPPKNYQGFSRFGESCLQFATLEGWDISQTPSVAPWTVFLSGTVLSPRVLHAAFGQLRDFERFAKLIGHVKGSPLDEPTYSLKGVIVATDLLGIFGPRELEAYVRCAEGRLKVKTILVAE